MNRKLVPFLTMLAFTSISLSGLADASVQWTSGWRDSTNNASLLPRNGGTGDWIWRDRPIYNNLWWLYGSSSDGNRVFFSYANNAYPVPLGLPQGLLQAREKGGLGNVSWQLETPEALVGTPLLVDGKIYVSSLDQYFGSRRRGDGAGVLVVDAMNGSRLDKFYVGGKWSSEFSILGDRMFAIVEGSRLGAWGLDGRLLWIAPLLTEIYLVAPTAAAGLVVVGFPDSTVRAWDVQDGALRWATSTGEMVLSNVAYGGGRFYVGSTSGRVTSLSEQGIISWNQETVNPEKSNPLYANYGPPVYEDGKVYLISSSPNGETAAVQLSILDSQTGRRIWAWHAPPVDFTFHVKDTRPVISGETVYLGLPVVRKLGEKDGYIFALNQRNHTEAWRLDGTSMAPLMYVDGILYYGGGNSLTAIDAGAGAPTNPLANFALTEESPRQGVVSVIDQSVSGGRPIVKRDWHRDTYFGFDPEGTFLVEGDHILTLRVEDDQGRFNETTLAFHVFSSPPTSRGISGLVLPGNLVTLGLFLLAQRRFKTRRQSL